MVLRRNRPRIEKTTHLRLREQGVIAATTNVFTRMELGTTLPHDDVGTTGRQILHAARFDSESRPFRVLPPAFLCAIFFSSFAALGPSSILLPPALELAALMPVIFTR